MTRSIDLCQENYVWFYEKKKDKNGGYLHIQKANAPRTKSNHTDHLNHSSNKYKIFCVYIYF